MNKTYFQIITALSFLFTSDLSNAMDSETDDKSSETMYTRASNKSFGKSDYYTREIPRPIEKDGIKYSTTAIQGMRTNNISIEDIENLIRRLSPKEFKGSRSFCQDNICIICKHPNQESPIDVSSTWRK